MNVWRINLKTSAKRGINPRTYCLENSLVGIGWPIRNWGDEEVNWKNYIELGRKNEGYKGKGWSAATNAIKNRMKIDDLIWTRDEEGNYFIGRILSDWIYDNSQQALDADMVNVRKCEWYKIGTVESVTGKVVNSFRARSTSQIVNDNAVKIFSKNTYNKKSNTQYYQEEVITEKDIFSLLSADDCEDALALFLQVEFDFMIIPSSCKKDTQHIEYELKHRKTGKKAVCQVKSGHVGLDANKYNKIESDVYLFATSGVYNKRDFKENIYFIDPETIRQFLFSNKILLPEKIAFWVNQITSQ